MPLPLVIALAAAITVIEVGLAAYLASVARIDAIERKNKALAMAAAAGANLGGDSRSRLEKLLANAGLEIEAKTFCALALLMTVLLAVAGWTQAGPAGALVGVLVLLAATWTLLAVRQRARKGAFERQLCEALPMIAEGIRSGMTFERAAQNAASFMDDPIREEFKRMAMERSYGVSLPQAIENIQKRTGSRDMVELTAVVAINAQTGGNMAGVIDSIAKNMQARARLRRHVSSVTANGRLSKNVITAIPVVLFVTLMAVAGDYMSVLLTVPAGWLMIGLSVALVAIGNFIISRLYKIKIY